MACHRGREYRACSPTTSCRRCRWGTSLPIDPRRCRLGRGCPSACSPPKGVRWRRPVTSVPGIAPQRVSDETFRPVIAPPLPPDPLADVAQALAGLPRGDDGAQQVELRIVEQQVTALGAGGG